MNKNILNEKKHIHFIGIGGAGMYPLVQILHSQGYNLTGSDNNETETLEAVRKLKIPVFFGQRAENIIGADLIVYTAAIMADNPELIAAKGSGVSILERSELLGIVTSWYDNAICVSGTHGKTTVSAMITQILMEQKIDISAVIGGKLACIGGSGRAGESDIMVCEACEFVDTFLKLYPDIAVILNIDADHLDYFKTVENIIRSFNKFCENTSKVIIVNGEDVNSLKAVESSRKEIITFGFSNQNNYYPYDIIKKDGMQTKFKLMQRVNFSKENTLVNEVGIGDDTIVGKFLTEITINVPGMHNVLNAVAAATAAIYVGADIQSVANGLEHFHGTGRRFEKIGTTARGVTVVDDYAHHPAEIAVTLKAAMEMGYKKVWAVFQPFTYSRTAMLLPEFVETLGVADKVVLTEIMGSREKNTYRIYTRDLGEKINGSVYFDDLEPGETIEHFRDRHDSDDRKDVHDKDFDDICRHLKEHTEEGDLVITLGCGDVYKIAKRFCQM